MASRFQQEALKVVVAQICQTIGFQGIFSAPLDVLIDLLHRYIREIACTTHRYTEHFGRTVPNIEDLGLAFDDMGISVSDLEEYITFVEPTGTPFACPKLPVPKQSNLNFLKPGAREILSRPLYVHEHLPPMHPEKEEEEVELNVSTSSMDEEGNLEGMMDKMPMSPSQHKRSSDGEVSPNKKLRVAKEEEGEPVREIDSVMMTTSGFISSAREGKMPEAKKPNIPMAPMRSSSPVSKSPSSLIKKKVTMEKIIRHKNHQGGIVPGPIAKSKNKSVKLKPKIPLVPPGTGSLKQMRSPGGIAPKLKIPNPNKPPCVKVEKGEKLPENIKVNPPEKVGEKTPDKPVEKKKKKEGKKTKEEGKVKEKEKKREKEPKKEKEKVPKKEKESKKEREPKKDKEGKKEGKKSRESKKDDKDAKKEKRKDRPRIRMKGLTKEEELKRYKARERELIAALNASPAVTVTSIPPPSLRVRENETTPEKVVLSSPEGKNKTVLSSPEGKNKTVLSSPEGKNKLSIFKKLNKAIKEEDKSRESSPGLMIDDIVVKEEKKTLIKEKLHPHSPVGVDYPLYNEEGSPPGTPSTPRTPEIHHTSTALHPGTSGKRGRTPHKWKRERSKEKEKKPPRERKSPRGGKRGGGPFSPSWRNPSDCLTPDRPKTPEGGIIVSDEMGSPSTFSLPPFPNAPSFIPPFSRFPFIPPFGVPSRPPCPPLPDINTISHLFMGHNPLPDKCMMGGFEDGMDNVDRPPTPSHDIGLGSPCRIRDLSPIVDELVPEPPKIIVQESIPHPPPKVDKAEKEKKKEHKKEKKEKEKEKEKLKKKKEKKEKEKAKEEKKKEKERIKQEKKEKKKVKKENKGGEPVPKITLKLQTETGGTSSSSSAMEGKPTPKLVIKPVMKRPLDDISIAIHSESKKRRLKSPTPPPTRTTIKLPPEEAPGSPPEIAKFSPLITRPPKGSQSKKNTSDLIMTVPPLKIKDGGIKISKKEPKEPSSSKSSKDITKEGGPSPIVSLIPPLKIKNTLQSTPIQSSQEKKSSKSSKKGEKKERKKRNAAALLFTMESEQKVPPQYIPPLAPNPPAPLPSPPAPPPPPPPSLPPPPPPSLPPPPPPTVVSLPEVIPPKVSKKPPAVTSVSTAGTVTTPASSSKASAGLLTETVGPIGHFVDDQGNEVWICPTCGKQDDGSPMIGCDTCDDWYHWLCVGIHVPPSVNENWYCPRCLSQHKQRGMAGIEKKKRGRKRKIIL